MMMLTVMTRMRNEDNDSLDENENLDVLGTIPQEERQALPNLDSRARSQLLVMII